MQTGRPTNDEAIKTYLQRMTDVLAKSTFDKNDFDNTLLEFMSQADLYSTDTISALSNYEISSKIQQKVELVLTIKLLQQTLEFIQKHNIPKEYIHVGPQQEEQQTPLIAPDGISCAAIALDESLNDTVIRGELETMLSDKVPFVISKRTLASILDKKEVNQVLDQAWWIFKNTADNIIVGIPQDLRTTPLAALKKLGYQVNNLQVISSDSVTTLQDMKDDEFQKQMDDSEHYQEQLAKELPLIFTDPTIKKRLTLIGHGSPESSRGPARISGLTVDQFKKTITELESLGLEYLNYITCFGGGNNLIRVFENWPHQCIVSVCSIDDEPVIAGIDIEGSKIVMAYSIGKGGNLDLSSFVSIDRPVNYKKFFDEINSVMTKTKLKADDFKKALEYIYGNNLSALPVVALPSKPYFESVNVHNRATVLTYKDLLTKELHPETKVESKSGELKSPGMEPLEVSKEIFLVYPQIVQLPIILTKNARNNKLPKIVSKVPDNNQIVFTQVAAKQVDLKDFVDLLKSDHSASKRVFFIKQLSLKNNEKLSHFVLIMDHKKFKEDTYSGMICFYQKPGTLNTWEEGESLYCRKKIDSVDVASYLYYCMTQRITTEKALNYSAGDLRAAKHSFQSVVDIIKEDFFPKDQILLLNALEKMDQGALTHADIEELSPKQRNAVLFKSIEDGMMEILQLCKDFDCDILRKNYFNRNIMLTAIQVPGVPVSTLELLKEMGASLHEPKVDYYESPLYYAVKAGRADIVEFLCKNVKYSFLNKALENAITDKHEKVIDTLFKFNLNVWDSNHELIRTALLNKSEAVAIRLLNFSYAPTLNGFILSSAIEMKNDNIFSIALDKLFNLDHLDPFYILQNNLFDKGVKPVWDQMSDDMKKNLLAKIKSTELKGDDCFNAHQVLNQLYELTHDDDIYKMKEVATESHAARRQRK